MMSDGPEEMLYSPVGGMHANTRKLFDNYNGVGCAKYGVALQRFLANTVAEHSYDDLSLNLLYLECVDEGKVDGAYRAELFEGVTACSQVKRVSSYAYHIDASLKPEGSTDLPFAKGGRV